METKEESKKYSTQSIYPAACVLALGAEIVGVKRESPEDRFLTFIFQGSFDMEAVALKLASKTLEVNAYELLEAYGRLKTLIHSQAKR